MKKLLTVAAILFCIGCSAQTVISTDTVHFVQFDSVSMEWEDQVEPWLSPCIMEFNEKWTVLLHTCEDITSTYYLKDKQGDLVKDGYLIFNSVSDAGGKYKLIIGKRMVFMYDQDGNTGIFYEIKSFIRNGK